ncbi:MAG: hypothetical protein FWD82_03475 [Defluviitaleaceae bacterium]|nr:hypothetical protein [Defluviitaleaceae bacterium]
MNRPAKPQVSKDFTIEDIHKVREYNYERKKNMSPKEYAEDINKGAEKGINRVEELRKKKVAI